MSELGLREVRSADLVGMITERVEIVEDSEQRLLLRAVSGLPSRWPDVMMWTGALAIMSVIGTPIGAPLAIIGGKNRRRRARKISIVQLDALCGVGPGSGYRSGGIPEVQLRDRSVPIELIKRVIIFYNEICLLTAGELISVFPPYYGKRLHLEPAAYALAKRCDVDLGFYGAGPLFNRPTI